jgi:hypothetical protein
VRQMDRRTMIGALGAAGLAALLETSCGAQPAGEPAIRSDGRSDDSAALQAAIDRASAAGGGEVRLRAGAATVARAAPVVMPNVILDLNGGTLLLPLRERNATGVRLRSNATLRNGSVVVRSSGSPSLQGAAHAPVVVGPLYGEGGTPGRMSPDEGVSGWTIRDLVLSSDKNVDGGGGSRVGAPAIQIMGGAHRGRIENIEVPDNPHMAGGVHLDWGTVGPIASASIPASAAAFRAGRAFTTHPHDIVVRAIRIGRLTRPAGGGTWGTFGVRLSGVYNVEIGDVTIESVTGAAFAHTAGDLGFEFAPAAVKPFACRGIRFSGGIVRDGATAYLIWSDSHADNVGRETARGYRPMLDPIHATDIVFERIEGRASGTRGANFGIRVDHQRGGRIVDCVARGYRRGFYIDEQVDGLALVRPVALESAESGISVEHPSRPPRNVLIEHPVARGNGRLAEPGQAAGILIGRSENVRIEGAEAPVGAVQRRGLRVGREALNVRLSGVAEAIVARD